MGLLDETTESRHEYFMREALRLAEKAADIGEVPIGSVVVHGDRVVGRGYNQRETLQDATAHAEMIAISAACQTLNSWRLDDCIIYVTLEPCTMCAGAIVLARLKELVYAASDPKGGACGTLYNIVEDERLNHKVETTSGVLAEQSAMILSGFFENIRANKNQG